MRSLWHYCLWIPACGALFAACEPDLDPLSSEFGSSGGTVNSAGGSSASGGKGGTAAGGSAGSAGSGGSAGAVGEGGENSAGVTGEGGSGGSSGNGSGGSPVISDTCADGVLGPDESDIDCGGSSLCVRCGLNSVCTDATDCASAVCRNGHCVAPSCTDKVLDQNETALDCGGVCAAISPCATGLACKVHSDCASDFCSARVCTDHCISKKLDSDETDIDCGGAGCLPCAAGLACKENADCLDNLCNQNVCVGPSCTDGIKNQDETEKDCGGVCRATKPCAVGDKCVVPGDCSSYICTTGHCVADIVIGATDMIDDMEDVNLVITRVAGRAGNWFAFGDGSGTALFEPVLLPVKRGTSAAALHYSGSGFKTWGSGIGFDFNNTGIDDTTKNPWDASAYTGITFWAKAATATSFAFQLPDRNTQKRGGVCTTCDFHWQATVSVGTDWERHTVHFTDLQLVPGTVPTPTAFDKTGIIMMQMFFSQGKTFEIWVDDIALVK